MNIVNTFLKLTNRTYPYGYEEELLGFLPDGYKTDEDGNHYYEVGTGSKTIFACHLDTACKKSEKVKHVFDGKFVRTNKQTILGADDKAGMSVILYMIHKNVPGLYYFFIGEEVGCIGSSAASKRVDFFSKYNRIISFDRRGTTSIITHQSSKRTCSDNFAEALSKEYAKSNLPLEKDDGGVYTDSAEFKTIISECTNISVGYYKEHTTEEHQDIRFLEDLAEASVRVDWESLPVSRDPSKTEWKSSDYYYYGGDRNYTPKRNSKGNWRARNNWVWSAENDDYVFSTKSVEKKFNDDDFYGNLYDTKKKGREFYNDLENQLTVDDLLGVAEVKDGAFLKDSSQTDYYKGVRKMFLDDTISNDELEIIKLQCLNMADKADSDFYKYMKLSNSEDYYSEIT